MVEQVSLILAYSAGLLSVLTPCVLPMIPTVLGYVSATEKDYKSGLWTTFAFVMGFTLIFTLLGIGASILGNFFFRESMRTYASIAIILIGLYIIVSAMFSKNTTCKVVRGTKTKFGAFGLGMFFAFAWMPCVGPILGSILTIAATQNVYHGALLLFVYSMGLGTPIMILGAFSGQTHDFINKLTEKESLIRIFSGMLMIIVGLYLFTLT